uniref:V-type proton ATPase subunit C n=1 Tax=Kalanchoe fedtschenkoi TaxID=63787 RepID=A0A7N0V042_KALFE
MSPFKVNILGLLDLAYLECKLVQTATASFNLRILLPMDFETEHIKELERVAGVDSSGLTIDGVPVDSYLTRFVWDEAKYPTMLPLRKIVDGIHVQVSKIEDDLKQTASLAVRDLSNLVKPEDIVTSEHLVTLLAVVPKYSQKDWLANYETLTNYVRVFTESILRYGLPPSFLLCDSTSSQYWKADDETGGAAVFGGDAGSYPYVSFTINLI